MDLKMAVNKLDALAVDAQARSKTAQLRDVLPSVERAIAAGVTHAKILEALKQSGLDLNPKTFASSLARLRAQAAAGPRVAQMPALGAEAPRNNDQAHLRAADAPSSAPATPTAPTPTADQKALHATSTHRRPSLEEVLAKPPNVTELEQRARRRERQERGETG